MLLEIEEKDILFSHHIESFLYIKPLMSRSSLRPSNGSVTVASNSFHPSSTYASSQSGSASYSRGSSRAGSRAASRRKKRDKIQHDHVPLTYLLGKRYKGYNSEIPSYPQAQPLHNDPREKIDNYLWNPGDGDRSLLGYESSSYASGSYGNSMDEEGGYNRSWISEPILDAALSRREREEAAREVLLGKKKMVGGDMRSVEDVVEENRREMREGNLADSGAGSGINPQTSFVSRQSGGRPTTSSSCMSPETGSIVPKIHDPRYPRVNAPVAEMDFLRVSESAKNLPWCSETQREAIEHEKQRLINKTYHSPSSELFSTQEELAVRREQKMVGMQRVRNAIHLANEMSRQRRLEQVKREKGNVGRIVETTREIVLNGKRDGVKSEKTRNAQRKRLAKETPDTPRCSLLSLPLKS